VREERPVVVVAPREDESAGTEAGDGADGDTVATHERSVADSEETDTQAGGQGLDGFLRAGDLRADPDGAAVAGVDSEPVVAQRSRAQGQGEERFVEQVGDVEDVSTGQSMVSG
jgi:hypothetical protein